MFKIINKEDQYNFKTHFVGVIIGAIALIVINYYALLKGSSINSLLGMNIFITSMILLYSASSYYHYLPFDDKNRIIARKLDHSMIFILIAGSYAPVCLTYLEGNYGIVFVSILFFIAVIGIIIKVFWLNAPRLLSTIIYLLMGWSLIFDFKAFSEVPVNLLIILLISGISYSIGAVIYIIKKPNFNKFGFHEIFHVFILLATIIQLIGFTIYVL